MDGISFGRYQLRELIGAGGMGQVWRAYDTDTDRIVAVRLLPEYCTADPSFRERFRREANATARLREPHVIPIHNYGEIGGRLYLDMRLIDGTDAKTLLAREGAMSPQLAVSVLGQAAAALDAAHAQGLVHRNVKPSNLLITDTGFVYLIDFGIAQAATELGLTSTGAAVGTLAYMAPERFTCGVADARSDVYSLTGVLCECLTGIRPYPGEGFEQQIAAHLTADPPTPSRWRCDLPVGFDDVVARGMAKDPDHRYRTAGELAAAARAALPGAAAPPAAPRPKQAPTIHARQFDSPPLARSEAETIRRETPAPLRRKRPGIYATVTLIAVLTAAVVVAGLWLNDHRITERAHTSQPPQPELAFNGKYEVTRTARTINGKSVDSPNQFTQVWSVRSYCPPHSERCVASVTAQDPSAPEQAAAQVVADYRDGAWIITRELPPRPDCTSSVNEASIEAPVWERIVVRFAAQAWTGTASSYGTGPCTNVQEDAMTLHRVGTIDPNVAVVAPETIPARVDMPIARISGTYDVTLTYIPTPDFPNPPPPDKVRQRYDTICMRSADRCAATTSPAPDATLVPLFVLEGGSWWSVYTLPYACYPGSNEPVTNATVHWDLSRSDAGPDPIKSLTGTWLLDKSAPCHATNRATVEMLRVGD
ncbi:serine/threonine-protein kinase [Nocardia sp. NPDC051990]|uniref:serine/threonine-protein kinase n=1 Tax=Nocardia sp. NPDC051990 TaxID=3155285 RepID=UPI0034429744